MADVRVVELAARQHNRFSRPQLDELGIGPAAIEHRLSNGDWVLVHDGVYAFAPGHGDDRARWMAATLTEPGTVLTHASCGAAWGWWDRSRELETVTRPGDGGPRELDGLLVHRSRRLEGEVVVRFGIPMTTVPRALLDLTPTISVGLLARCVRESIRLKTTTAHEIVDALTSRHRGRRGVRRLTLVVARYCDLPLERARSGAEVRALEVLRDAGRVMPALNSKIAGEEADLSWPAHRLIVEIDGGPWHLDRGEDARKEAVWRRAGYVVRRLPSEAIHEAPSELLSLAPNVHRTRP